MLKRIAGALIGLAVALPCFSAETDQYMTWDRELEDAGPLLNAYLNEEIGVFVDKMNARTQKVDACYEFVQEFYLHMFQGLHSARIRDFLRDSEEVDRYPGDEVGVLEKQQMTIYRRPAFPFVLPLSPTIRLGDIYLGIDKMSHFFGFGRRYFTRFIELRKEGVPEQEALERIVHVGIWQESILVGGLVDGVFSHGDLEANYQGFTMARWLCNTGFFELDDEGVWHVTRELDIIPFITPDFDESWNNSHFQRRRLRMVLPVLVEDYCDLRDHPIVQARFKRYAEFEPSFSKQYIEQFFIDRHGYHPQHVQSLDKLCAYCAKCEEEQEASLVAEALSRRVLANVCP